MNRTHIKRIAVVAIALSLIGGVALAPASMAAAPNRYITMSAEGSVKVAPDAVRLTATVTNVADTNKNALAATATVSSAVRAALVANSIATKDIATQNVTAYPEYNYTPEKQILIGYRASQTFVVVIRKAKTAGAVVDAVVAAGGDAVQVTGVSPFVLDSTKSVDSARYAAVKNAKTKANKYAALLGVRLGKVIYIVENSAPQVYVGPQYAMAAKADSAATQVDLGQQDVSVSITVQWALL